VYPDDTRCVIQHNYPATAHAQAGTSEPEGDIAQFQ